MILKGQKRKLEPEVVDVSGPSGPLWERQRQFVFSVSLNKYQRGQELPEPSLRRSVLIANTLRQITLEDGGAAEETPPPWFRLQAKEQENFSFSAAISSILTALDSTIDGGPQAAPRPPLRSLENLSSPRLRQSGGEAAKPSYLNDVTMEDLLQDVDASLLERDVGRAAHPAEEELISAKKSWHWLCCGF
uniref:SERTA domain-containing protein n=1 Tax=Fundulus heteroclitus TaxID=8078 RepID=A0A3Q2UN70_FUNHE